jgi:hypothetical protein
MPLKTGILISGSLYWRNVPHRSRWREQFLHMERATAVKVPIRYGRLSRSNTYTMVYAPETPPGQAKVVPCKHDIASPEDIVTEAAALWAAEQSGDAGPPPAGSHSAQWGCVGLLPNPQGNVPNDLLEAWAQHVSAQRSGRNGARNYDPANYAVRGQVAIDARGRLQIPWPCRSGTGQALDGFDILLATATKPTPDRTTRDFVDTAAIAAAWNQVGDASYFHSNRKHGFETFQDREIAALLRL